MTSARSVELVYVVAVLQGTPTAQPNVTSEAATRKAAISGRVRPSATPLLDQDVEVVDVHAGLRDGVSLP